MKDTYTKYEVMEMLKPVIDANDNVQEWVLAINLPNTMLKDLSDLDWAIRNVGENDDN